MSLLRFAARTMLASYFVVSGLKALRDPDRSGSGRRAADRPRRTDAQAVRARPGQRLDPEDPVTLVRINGVLQLVGGLALATGKGRRLGALILAASLIPTTIAKHPFWTP